MTTTTGPLATRRLILQGAASVALFGLDNLPFAATPAHAAANDKYPEAAFNLVGNIDDAIEKGKKLLAQAQG